jgi:hypothetical protein
MPGVARTTTLTVNPASQMAALTVTATGRSGERITSSPTGINVSVGNKARTCTFMLSASASLTANVQ